VINAVCCFQIINYWFKRKTDEQSMKCIDSLGLTIS
jgi:hypothetical protein